MTVTEYPSVTFFSIYHRNKFSCMILTGPILVIQSPIKMSVKTDHHFHRLRTNIKPNFVYQKSVCNQKPLRRLWSIKPHLGTLKVRLLSNVIWGLLPGELYRHSRAQALFIPPSPTCSTANPSATKRRVN